MMGFFSLAKKREILRRLESLCRRATDFFLGIATVKENVCFFCTLLDVM